MYEITITSGFLRLTTYRVVLGEHLGEHINEPEPVYIKGSAITSIGITPEQNGYSTLITGNGFQVSVIEPMETILRAISNSYKQAAQR